MPTPWEMLKRAAQIEFKSTYTRMEESDWNEALVQAIHDYSVDRPLLKSATLTITSSSTDVALPADFLGLAELSIGGSWYQEQALVLNWATGQAWESGSFTVHDRAFLRFRSALDGTGLLSYYGAHAPDGSTLSPRDVTRIKPLYFSMGYDALSSQSSRGGRIQAGPVSWDDGAIRTVYEAKSSVYRAQYEKLVQNRAYGTRSSGADFNTREPAYTGVGEWIG